MNKKEIEENKILESLAQDLCDRVSKALKGYRRNDESLDDAVIRMRKELKKVKNENSRK